MTPNCHWSRIHFASMCLWVILTVREIHGNPPQGWQYWNPYNLQYSQSVYNKLWYPKCSPFSQNPSPKVQNSSNVQSQSQNVLNFQNEYEYSQWIFLKDWINYKCLEWLRMNSLQKSLSTSVPAMNRTTEIQQGRYNPRKNNETILIGDDSSMDHDVPTTKYPKTFQKLIKTAVQQEEKPGSKTVLREELTSVTTNQSAKFAQDDISKLIKDALRRGELLYIDEWLKRRNAVYAMQELAKKTSKMREDEANPRENRDANIYIPDNRNITEFRADTVPVCNGSTFCLNAANYPEQLVNLAFQRNDSLRLLSDDDQTLRIAQRLDDGLNDAPLCHAYARVVYPRSAENANQRWLYVVNQENFRQGVRIEMCIKEGSNCGGIDEYLPEGYQVLCKQRYIYRELMAVLPDGTVNKDIFKFPASCCCHRDIKSAYNIF